VRQGELLANETLYRQAASRLQRMARSLMAGEGKTAGFGPSDLVQEAILQKRLKVGFSAVSDTEHFFALMRRGMKQVLVDRSRRRDADKRQIPTPDNALHAVADPRLDDLGKALRRLRSLDARAYKVLRLRSVEGYKWEEIAEMVNINVWDARRDYGFALNWLRQHLEN